MTAMRFPYHMHWFRRFFVIRNECTLLPAGTVARFLRPILVVLLAAARFQV